MNFVNIMLILLGVLLNATAQLCLKQGMSIIGNVSMDMNGIIALIPKAAFNPYIITGMFFYVISFLVWLIVLSKVEVSIAYPALSIGYVVVAFVGCFFMNEALSTYKIIGIIMICVGTACMFKS